MMSVGLQHQKEIARLRALLADADQAAQKQMAKASAQVTDCVQSQLRLALVFC